MVTEELEPHTTVPEAPDQTPESPLPPTMEAATETEAPPVAEGKTEEKATQSPGDDDWEAPITSGLPPVITPPAKKKTNRKIIGGLVALLVLAISIPAGVFLVQQQQELQKRAAEEKQEFNPCDASISCDEAAQNSADPSKPLYCREIGSSTENTYMWVTKDYANDQCDANQKGRIARCGGETYTCRGNSRGDWVKQGALTPCDSSISCGQTQENPEDPSKPLYCRNLGIATQFEYRWVTQEWADQACNANTQGSISECGGEKFRCNGSPGGWEKVFDEAKACDGSFIPVCGPYPNNKLIASWKVTPPPEGECNIFIQANQISHQISTNCEGQQTITSISGDVNQGGGPITNDGIYQLVISNGQSDCTNEVVKKVELSCAATGQPSQPSQPGAGTGTPAARCQEIKIYDTRGNLIADPQGKIKPGERVVFAVKANIASNNFDKALFLLGTEKLETTLLNDSGEFYVSYIVPENLKSFTVGAVLHHKQLDQWF